MMKILFIHSILAISVAAFAPQRSLVRQPLKEQSLSFASGRQTFPLYQQTDDYITGSDELADFEPILDTDSSGVDLNYDAIESSTDISEAVTSFLEQPNSTESYVDASLGNTFGSVEAILAASGEAAIAADASLSVDLGDNLTFAQPEPTDATKLVQVDSIPEILPASEVVGESTVAEKIEAPPVSKILKFAIPAIGVWLCGPLLSLIDTSTVGVLSGTTQQAALNPAVAVTDYAALLIAFLFTGTTNLIAAARETDRGVEGAPRTTKTFVGALQLSTFVGAGLGAILFAFARPLLRTIIGNDGISPAVFDAAMKYVRIRALGMPAAAVIGSAQAACLGIQDIRSPLYVLLAAAIVNFCGDMIFVGSTHPLIGGAAGAAWATVFSQFAAVGLFVHWLCHKPKKHEKPKVINLSKAILELTGKPSSAGEGRRRRFLRTLRSFTGEGQNSEANQETPRSSGRLAVLVQSILQKRRAAKAKKESKPKEDSVSVRGFLESKFRGRDLGQFPTRRTVKEFAPYMLPVTTTQVGRVSGYVAMSHVVSSSLGTVSMAAQQVIVSLFYCLCPIADSLSLTAQSFVPAISEKTPSMERSKALRKTAINFLKAGAVFGSVMVGAVSSIPLLSHFFTTDPVVIALVNSVAPFLIFVCAVHGLVCSGEGVLLGQKDLSFLGRMYAAYFAVVPYFMFRVKRAALSGSHGINLTSVWKVFLGYQLFRFGAWMGRIAMLQHKTHREAVRLSKSAP